MVLFLSCELAVWRARCACGGAAEVEELSVGLSFEPPAFVLVPQSTSAIMELSRANSIAEKLGSKSMLLPGVAPSAPMSASRHSSFSCAELDDSASAVCAMFVRLRQSRQLVRTTPRCVRAAVPDGGGAAATAVTEQQQL